MEKIAFIWWTQTRNWICADQYQDKNKTHPLVLLISRHCEELLLAHIFGSLHNPWDKLKNAKTVEQKELFLLAS